MVEKVCSGCGVTFLVKPYRANAARYCSSRCWANSAESKDIVARTQRERHKNKPTTGTTLKNKVVKHCKWCGSALKLLPSRSAREFCSRQCAGAWRNGQNNPSWKGGITPLACARVRAPAWKKLRKQIISERGEVCECCGGFGNHIHHIKAVRDGGTDDIANLMVLCNFCHRHIEHFGKCPHAVIKEKCVQCHGGTDCRMTTCPLYPFVRLAHTVG